MWTDISASNFRRRMARIRPRLPPRPPPCLPLRLAAAQAPSPSWHRHGRRVVVASEPDGRPLALHVVTVGDGPDLVLLPGYLQSSWSWRHNLVALAGRFRVHAVCLPGFGWSDRPQNVEYRLDDQLRRLLGCLDALGIGRFDLIGHSLGGSLALRLCLTHPERVGRLVLVSPAVSGLYPMALIAALQHPRWAPLLALPGVPHGLWAGLQHIAYRGATIDADYMDRFLLPLHDPGGRRAALAIARAYNADLAANDRLIAAVRPLPPALAARVAILHGDHDLLVPSRAVARLASRLPVVRRFRFAASGHCPMEEEPGRFNRVVLEHLDESTRA